jgi:hypothetical protein
MSMERLWCDQGKRDQVRKLLAPVYGRFTEGSDTPDLKQAKTLIDELAASGCTCRLVADSVAKVSKRRATKFPLNDKTSGNRRSM